MQTLWQSTHAYTLLQADKKRGCFAHAYLLLLDDATLLRTALKSFVKLFFNAEENGSRTGKLIDLETFSDCLFFPAPEKKFVVEDAERVGEECALKPVEGDVKVFVIADFAQATPAAQNKLLKLLEEPPQGVIFLLGATTAFSVLPTVLSRVKKLEIPPFDVMQLTRFLRRAYENAYSDEEYALCAAASGGCAGTAQSMLDGGAYKKLIEDAFALCLTPPAGLPALVKRLGETKRKKELLALLRLLFRDALIIKLGEQDANTNAYVLLLSERLRLSRIAQRFSLSALIRAQELLVRAERELFFNAVFAQCLEVLMSGIFALE